MDNESDLVTIISNS